MTFNPTIWDGGGGWDGPAQVSAESLLRSHYLRQARENVLADRKTDAAAQGHIYLDPRESLPISQGGFNPDPTVPPIVPVSSVVPVAASAAAPVAASTAPAGTPGQSLMPLVALGVILYLVFK